MAIPDEDLEAVIDAADVTTQKIMEKTTIMGAKLPNGYELVVSSSCVDPQDFDPELGRSICRDRLKAKLSDYLGGMNHHIDNAAKAVLESSYSGSSH